LLAKRRPQCGAVELMLGQEDGCFFTQMGEFWQTAY